MKYDAEQNTVMSDHGVEGKTVNNLETVLYTKLDNTPASMPVFLKTRAHENSIAIRSVITRFKEMPIDTSVDNLTCLTLAELELEEILVGLSTIIDYIEERFNDRDQKYTQAEFIEDVREYYQAAEAAKRHIVKIDNLFRSPSTN